MRRLRERNRPRIAAQIGARARLVEVQRRRGHLDVAEGGARDVKWLERNAPARQRREQRLLPFRVFVQDDEIGSHECPSTAGL